MPTTAFLFSAAARRRRASYPLARPVRSQTRKEHDHVTLPMAYPVELAESHRSSTAPYSQTRGGVRTSASKPTRPGHMIRAVIFDWGGVFMRTVDPSFRLAWDARLGLTPGSIQRLFFESAEWQRAQL